MGGPGGPCGRAVGVGVAAAPVSGSISPDSLPARNGSPPSCFIWSATAAQIKLITSYPAMTSGRSWPFK